MGAATVARPYTCSSSWCGLDGDVLVTTAGPVSPRLYDPLVSLLQRATEVRRLLRGSITLGTTPAFLRHGRTAAAFGAAALTLAGTTAFAPSAGAAQLTGLKYTCSALTVDGDEHAFSQPWALTISADLPATLKPGERVSAPEFTAQITMGSDAAPWMRDQGVTELRDGGSLHLYTVGGQERTAEIVFNDDAVKVPTSGTVTVKGDGEGEAFRAAKSTGDLKVKVDAMIVGSGEGPDDGIFVYCDPMPGQDLTLATIKVTDIGPAPTSTATHTPKPTASTTPTGRPTVTSTGTRTSTGTVTSSPGSAESTTSSGTASGPVVQTDRVDADGTSSTTIAMGGIGLLAVASAAFLLARRRITG